MADTKISALTVATTPLAGTEVLPIVQSGVTKQVTVANLTAGRAVSALSLTLTNALAATSGGTGQSSYAVGDLLYASSTTALSKLADVATGNALISGGVGVAPAWGKIGLTTHITGVLPVANGGTNASSAGITAFNNITGYSASGATGTTSTNLVFSTSPSITTPTLVGDVALSTGNIVQGTAAKGINFTANSAAAGKTSQLLNWYEEGTWTPVLTDGTNSATMSGAGGRYTRIGRQVTISALVQISSLGSVTGSVRIIGIPFNAATNEFSKGGIAISQAGGLNITAGQAIVGSLASNNTDVIYLQKWSSTSGLSDLLASNLTASSYMYIYGTYFV